MAIINIRAEIGAGILGNSVPYIESPLDQFC